MKTCSRCGETKPIEGFSKGNGKDGYHSWCKMCAKAYRAAYYETHKERLKAYARKYYEIHKEEQRAVHRKWLEAHEEEQKAYRAAHEEMAACGHKWQQANPEKVAVHWQKRKARKLGAGGSFTAEEFQALCEKAGNRCLCCGSSGPLTIDHIVPLSRGGSNNIENIQPLCQSCNSSKGTKTINYWGKGGDMREFST